MIKKVWKMFNSMQLALYLLGAIIFFSTIGTLIPQKEVVVKTIWDKLVVSYQLNSMYSSPLFKILIMVMLFNIVVCTSTHLYYLYKDVKRQKKIKRKHMTSLGAHLVHISILLFFLGALVGKIYGEKESVFLTKGEEYVIEKTQNIIKLDYFDLQYDAQYNIKDYVSFMTIYNPSREVIATKAVQVNDPLVLDGYYFYQSTYGKIQVFTLTEGEKTNEIFLRENQPLKLQNGLQFSIYKYFSDFSGGNGFNSYNLSPQDKNPAAWVVVRGGKMNTAILKPGEEFQIDENIKVKFEENLFYTGLSMARDPGAIYIWVASVVMTIGLIMAFYIRREERN
jgi:cytochrome c biogenesis protein ResB